MAKKILTILTRWAKVPTTIGLIFSRMKSTNKEIINVKYLDAVDFSNRIFIPWGSLYNTEKIKNSFTYNTQSSIRLANLNEKSRGILSRYGINVPRMVDLGSENINYPVIARPKFHSRGKNFVVLHTEQEFVQHYMEHRVQGWYYSEYIDKVREFRVNIGHGKILNVLQRYVGHDQKFNWNKCQTGIDLTMVDPVDFRIEWISPVIKSMITVGLDFAGVDIIVDEQGEYYILDLNPYLSVQNHKDTRTKLARYFDWLAASDSKRPHWNINSDNPGDYAWKESDWSGD